MVADSMSTSPSKEEADEAWLISTTDIDQLMKRCKDNAITAIMFGASDFNIGNCRELCKRLGLSIYCDDDIVWDKVRDKRVFKEICKEVGAPIATDYVLSDLNFEIEAGNIAYPIVVKPSDKSGNRGMSFCNDKDEFVVAYKKAREISDKSIIVERMLHGSEYNVHYALADGEASLLYFSSTHHKPGQPSNIYSFKCTTSNHLKQYIDEVDELAKQVIKKMGCREGIAWFDVMRDADGKFYLLEMGYRFGGVMTYIPYEKVSGFNAVKWMLDIACGIKHKVEDLPRPLNQVHKSIAASYHLFAAKDCTINRLYGLDHLANMSNVFIDIPKRIGSNVRGLASMGLLGIFGEDIEDLCLKLQEINKVLKVEDEVGNEIIIKYDDVKTLQAEYYNGLTSFNAEI